MHLQIEEDLAACRVNRFDGSGTGGREQLQADLEDRDAIGERIDRPLRLVEAGRVQRDRDRRVDPLLLCLRLRPFPFQVACSALRAPQSFTCGDPFQLS